MTGTIKAQINWSYDEYMFAFDELGGGVGDGEGISGLMELQDYFSHFELRQSLGWA